MKGSGLQNPYKYQALLVPNQNSSGLLARKHFLEPSTLKKNPTQIAPSNSCKKKVGANQDTIDISAFMIGRLSLDRSVSGHEGLSCINAVFGGKNPPGEGENQGVEERVRKVSRGGIDGGVAISEASGGG